MSRARSILVLFALLMDADPWSLIAAEAPPPLSIVRQVLELSRDEAQAGRAFKIQGIVTFSDPISDTQFVQDDSGGISFNLPSDFRGRPLALGDKIEIEGEVTSGGFAPVLRVKRIELRGQGALPSARSRDWSVLISGREDSQRISVEGVLQSYRRAGHNFVLSIITSAGNFTAYLLTNVEESPPEAWIGSELRLTGVCTTKFTMRNQIIGFELLVQDRKDIELLQLTPRDPFQMPETRIDHILAYDPKARHPNRIRVKGIATLARPDGLGFLQSGALGLRIELEPGQSMVPGEEVEVVGYPKPGIYGPRLEHSQVKRGQKMSLPPPVHLTSTNCDGTIDALRAKVIGVLVDQQTIRGKVVLRMRSEGFSFEATCPWKPDDQGPTQLQPGTELELTGVAVMANDPTMGPPELQLYLQDYNDLRVLAAPPWYRRDSVKRIIPGLVIAIVLGAFWVVSLRRTIQVQTANIERRNESERALERRLKEMAENASDMIFTLDLDGRITGVNPAIEAILGYTQAGVVGIRFDSLLTGESREFIRHNLARKAAGDTRNPVYQVEARTKFGTLRTLEISSRGIYRGSTLYEIEGVARDVTEREKAREASELRQAILYRAGNALTELVQNPAFQRGNTVQCIHAVASAALQGIQASHASVWILSDDGKELFRRECFDASEPLHSPARSIPMDKASGLIGAMSQARCVTTEDAAMHPATRELLDFGGSEKPQKRAAVLASITLEGRWFGCVFVEAKSSPRNWLPEEQLFAASVADCASIALGTAHQRRIADALRQSEERQRYIVNNLAEGVLILDSAGTVQECNASAARILGMTTPSILGTSLFDKKYWRTVREDGTPLPMEDWPAAQVLRNGASVSNFVLGLRNPENALIWLSVNAGPLHFQQDEQPTGVVVSFFDITPRKKFEATLRASEERYRGLMENLNDLVAEVASDGRFVYANPCWERVLGFPPSILLGQDFLGRVHPDDQATASADLARELPVVLRFGHREGGWRLLECAVKMFTTAAGEDRGVIVARDITDRVESEKQRQLLQEQVYQSHKMESLGTLAGGVAHDFNNILATILGNVDVLAMETPPGHPHYEAIVDILTATHRARDLVHQILTFSRKQVQPREPVHLPAVVSETLRLLRPTIPTAVRVEIAVENSDRPLAILASRVRVEQVILNLASNALNAMLETGGTLGIKIGAWSNTIPAQAFQPHPKPIPYVELTVSDEGKGISPEDLPRIFDPFFTTKAPGVGTGLGLAVVHGILRDHDACITVQSQPGHGATFTILFPASDIAPGLPAERTPGGLPILGRNERIAIVDDEAGVASQQAALLQSIGYQPTAFTDPRTALEKLSPADSALELLIADYSMPDMTGIELARELRIQHPEVAVILCSGSHDPDLMRQSGLAGIQLFLAKPVQAQALARAVDEVLHSSEKSNLGSTAVSG